MKYENLLKLKDIWIRTPDFVKYEGNLSVLKKLSTNTVILRSSYKYEDTEQSSLAWVFTSAWPFVSSNEEGIWSAIMDITDNAAKKIKVLWGVIDDFVVVIQIYITTDVWWVLIKDWDKILFEVSSWKWAEKVVKWDKEYSFYKQWPCEIENGTRILTSKQQRKLLRVIKKIEKHFWNKIDVEFWFVENKLYVFQVRPLVISPFIQQNILESSNIIENFPENVSFLTATFFMFLYEIVYKTAMYQSWVKAETITKVQHIFKNLIVYKDKKLTYNIANWYKMMLLIPWSHKTPFDTMLWSTWKINYLLIDDIKDFIPTYKNKISYCFLLLRKLIVFPFKISSLKKQVKSFTKKMRDADIRNTQISTALIDLRGFVQEFAYAWYITIENDFLIMKLTKDMSLSMISGLITAKQLESIQDLASWKIILGEYVEKYGHRFGNELTLEQPDIIEQEADLMQFIKTFADSWKIQTKEPSKPIPFYVKFLIKNREMFRLYRSEMVSIVRRYVLYMADFLVTQWVLTKKEEVFWLTRDELFTHVQNSTTLTMSNANEKTIIWKGFLWTVYVVEEFHIPKQRYDILVASHFDPGRLILLWNVKWVILENGTLLSHIAMLCREKNIPLLIWAKGIVKKVKNGDFINVLDDWTIVL